MFLRSVTPFVQLQQTKSYAIQFMGTKTKWRKRLSSYKNNTLGRACQPSPTVFVNLVARGGWICAGPLQPPHQSLHKVKPIDLLVQSAVLLWYYEASKISFNSRSLIMDFLMQLFYFVVCSALIVVMWFIFLFFNNLIDEMQRDFVQGLLGTVNTVVLLAAVGVIVSLYALSFFTGALIVMIAAFLIYSLKKAISGLSTAKS